jgi:CubicO group peptidase (beta-lactamase class C family)
VPLGPGHRFPALQITALVTSTAVLRLVAEGAVALDDPVNGHLRWLRLADDAVTVRELLAHTGGVDSPPPLSLWAGSVADVAEVLGQLIADLTGTSFAQAATRLVLEPLGLADSWSPAGPPSRRTRRAATRSTTKAGLNARSRRCSRCRARAGCGRPGRISSETGLGWGLRRSMDVAGQAGIGPGWAASLITRPNTARTIATLTSRLFPVLALNVELIRSAA